jgi:hypothetical protein
MTGKARRPRIGAGTHHGPFGKIKKIKKYPNGPWCYGLARR